MTSTLKHSAWKNFCAYWDTLTARERVKGLTGLILTLSGVLMLIGWLLYDFMAGERPALTLGMLGMVIFAAHVTMFDGPSFRTVWGERLYLTSMSLLIFGWIIGCFVWDQMYGATVPHWMPESIRYWALTASSWFR